MTDLRHSWTGCVVRISAEDSPNGCEQTERTCARCGIVKVTVHPPQGNPWIEWRYGQSRAQQVAFATTPPCGPQVFSAETYAHCRQTWDANLRRHPDLLEPYLVSLDNAESDADRLRIMRQGLAETFTRRYPFPDSPSLRAPAVPSVSAYESRNQPQGEAR